MNIAELFILIAIKDQNKTKKQLEETQKGLKGVAEAAFGAVAAVYELAHGVADISKAGANVGTLLKQFSLFTTLPSGPLQALERAFSNAAVPAKDVEQSILAIQSHLAELITQGAAPGSLFGLMGINPQDIKDEFDFFQKAVTYIRTHQKDKNFNRVVNLMMTQLGIAPSVIGGARSPLVPGNIFPNLPSNMVVTPAEQLINQKTAAAWQKLSMDFSTLEAKISAIMGGSLVTTLDRFVLFLNHIADLFERFSDKHPDAAKDTVRFAGSMGAGGTAAMGAAGAAAILAPELVIPALLAGFLGGAGTAGGAFKLSDLMNILNLKIFGPPSVGGGNVNQKSTTHVKVDVTAPAGHGVKVRTKQYNNDNTNTMQPSFTRTTGGSSGS